MVHSFDVDIAAKYGFQCAVLINYLYFWIEKNRANEKHFHEGRYWTYNSVKAMTELFPYMSRNTIVRALSKLEEEGLIVTGTFNNIVYNRTKWYALTDLGYSVCSKSEMCSPKIRNELTQNQKSLNIYNNTDSLTVREPFNNTYIDNDDSEPTTHEESPSEMNVETSQMSTYGLKGHDIVLAKTYGFANDDNLLHAFADFYQMRKAKKKPMTETAVKMLSIKLNNLAYGDVDKKVRILNQSTFNSWTGVFPLKDDAPEENASDDFITTDEGRQ